MRDYFVHTIKVDIEKVKARIQDSITKVESGCWEWNREKAPNNYGKYRVMGETLAHRVSYIIHNEESIQDMCVMHSCDNPCCVNPEHLSLGSRDDNNKDRAAKKRNNHRNDGKTHCIRGHEFTEENTFIRKGGDRLCKACNNLRATSKYRNNRKSKGKKVGPKNKDKTHCKRGHEFTEENTMITSQKVRQCRICTKIRRDGLK